MGFFMFRVVWQSRLLLLVRFKGPLDTRQWGCQSY